MAHTLITGANRGIGLELARQCAARGDVVIATARRADEASELAALGVRVEPLDVSSAESVDRLAAALRGVELDWLINNAGVFPDRNVRLDEADPEAMMDCLRVNTLGPMLVTRSLRRQLTAGRPGAVVNISSTMGSIENARSNGSSRNIAYHTSKAALNMVTALMGAELKDDGVLVVAAHPGWVRTDMGGQEAAISAAESASTLLNAWNKLAIADTGRFLDTDGSPLPW